MYTSPLYSLVLTCPSWLIYSLIRLPSPWPMKSQFSQFPTARLHPPVLARALLHSCTLHAPQSAFLRFAAFPRCECSALLPVLGHPCVCPLALSLANAPYFLSPLSLTIYSLYLQLLQLGKRIDFSPRVSDLRELSAAHPLHSQACRTRARP